MIRDPQFNFLYAAQPAPWGASHITSVGYLVPLSALHSEIPSNSVQGSLDSPLDKSPEERLEAHVSSVQFVEGTWTQVSGTGSTSTEQDIISPVSPVSPLTASLPVTPSTPMFYLAPIPEEDK
ncbi:hypothetical protein BCR39DRAFT_590548 [Naematelia encephala]|uniref:Uncharacterized protein n=1 Tax=Naematelia encephala TaxID=71784 RepID=A0A1Y2APX7_9TREE|nr:hypothetical protein BCR39DRAFT_590548 [Naematelia encephala]